MNNINLKLEKYGLSVYKVCVTGTGILLSLLSLFIVIFSDEYFSVKNIFCVLATILLLLGPIIVGNLFKFNIQSAWFTFAECYAVASPLLGSVFLFYNFLPWWDEMLHIAGGLVFAILGVYMAKFLNKNNNTSLVMCAVFAFCFSMMIAVLWEFYEFGMDNVFGFDMQRDTIVNSIISQNIGNGNGKPGIMEGIFSTVITGEDGQIKLSGYIDIGLIDTMKDMLVEGLGALAYCVIFLIDKDKHPILTPIKRHKTEE